MKIAYIFLNGELQGNPDFYKDFIKENEGDIYCADGGSNICYSLGLIPFEIWGDLDSIEEKIRKYYEENKVKFEIFSTEKDKTDSELLLDYLKIKNYDEIYCIAGLGGDIDHELTNLNLCFKYKNLIFLNESQKIFPINRSYKFKNLKNKRVSFIIFSDEVKNLSLSGFKYDVKALNLLRGNSRCMSNIIWQNEAEIVFDKGLLLTILKN